MAKDLLNLSLSDILPSSIASDPQVSAAATALDPELQSVSHDIRETLILSRIDELSEPIVDLLAWQWHVDFYELAKTLAMKRATVKGSIPWHRKKGTRWAILEALKMLGIEGTFIPWWEIAGAKPYTFAIKAKITDEYYVQNSDWNQATKTIRRAIEASKAKRSWLVSLDTWIQDETICDHTHGVATFRGGVHSIGIERPELRPMPLTAGIATAKGGIYTLRLARPELPPKGYFSGIATLQTYHITIGPAPGQTGGF